MLVLILAVAGVAAVILAVVISVSLVVYYKAEAPFLRWSQTVLIEALS